MSGIDAKTAPANELRFATSEMATIRTAVIDIFIMYCSIFSPYFGEEGLLATRRVSKWYLITIKLLSGIVEAKVSRFLVMKDFTSKDKIVNA